MLRLIDIPLLFCTKASLKPYSSDGDGAVLKIILDLNLTHRTRAAICITFSWTDGCGLWWRVEATFSVSFA